MSRQSTLARDAADRLADALIQPVIAATQQLTIERDQARRLLNDIRAEVDKWDTSAAEGTLARAILRLLTGEGT